MTVPHDERAPHRQQRWIECKNVGGTTLQPYAVAEVVESTRPDTGRTVLNVRQATCDGPENTVVLGHMQILAGEYGYCTNDFPAYALYDTSDTPTPGEVWGVASGTQVLAKGIDGYLIVGDADATKGIVRVRRTPPPIRLYKVKATTCHYPGGTDTMDLWVFDLQTMTWVDAGATVTVYDPEYKAMLVPGEFAWVAKFIGPNCTERYEIIAEQGLFRVAKANANIACESSGSVTIYYHDSVGSCTPTASSCTVTACNNWGLTRRVESGEEVHIRFLEKRWVIIPTPKNQTIEASLGANLCPTDASASITGGYVDFDMCDDRAPTSAANDFSLSGLTGDKVLLKYDQEGDRWVVVQVQHHEHTILVDSMLRFVSGTGSCVMQGYELKYTSVMSCDTPAWEDELSYTPVTVLQDVDINGLCFEGTIATVYVPCTTAPTVVELFCGVDCSTGS